MNDQRLHQAILNNIVNHGSYSSERALTTTEELQLMSYAIACGIDARSAYYALLMNNWLRVWHRVTNQTCSRFMITYLLMNPEATDEKLCGIFSEKYLCLDSSVMSNGIYRAQILDKVKYEAMDARRFISEFRKVHLL